jgi:translation initiation factor IF-3
LGVFERATCSLFAIEQTRGSGTITPTNGRLQWNRVFYLANLFSYTTLKSENVRINQSIRAKELRVIGVDGENIGVISTKDALKIAEEANLDLIEISPNAAPPVAKIMDYGKYQYELKKKAKEVKAKSHVTETKSVQVKIGTGDHDLNLKAKRAAEWLTEGHRVKIDLFLWGRYKYMEPTFLKERLERFLKIIPAEYKIADEIKKSPKGFSTTLERVAQQKGAK